MGNQKHGLEFETKKDAGLMASKTGKYDKSELYEIFNGDTPRSEKMNVLEEIAGDSQAVIAPTRGYPYQPELNSDDTVRDVYFNEIDDVELSVVPKGEIDRGGDYWIMISKDMFIVNFREVDKEAWEFIENARASGDFEKFEDALNEDFKYKTDFQEGLTISGNRNHYVVVPKPSDFDSKDYFSVKFDYFEKMVRLGRGGSYSKRWYQGKTIEHSENGIARIEGDNGFYIFAETLITGYSDDKADLAKVVKLEGKGKLDRGMTGFTVVPTEDYSSYEDLKQQVMDSDLGMETFEVVEELKDNDISVKRRDLDYDLDEGDLEKILSMSPKPLVVGNEFLSTMKGKPASSVDKTEIVVTDNIRSFTGADQQIYELEKGDIVNIPKADKQELSFRDYETLDRVKDKIEGADIDWTVTRVNDGWNISNGDLRMGATLDYMDNSIKVILQGSAVEKYIDWNDASEGDSLGLGKVLDEDKYRVPKYNITDIIETIVSTLEGEESELSDSGSALDSVYEDYQDLVNMTPGDIDDRMDNMDCVHKASGDDAVEHLKRNKFIQETNKSEWDSKKVPEEYANDSAESRKVVDQAVRTVSFGKRHLAQLENESITRMEDGCYNPRVEGLKNWGIDPLEMSGFSVDEDNYPKSELSDSSVKYGSSSVRQDSLGDSSGRRISGLSDAKSVFMDLDIEDDSQESFVVGYLGSDNSFLGFEEFGSGDSDSINFDNSDVVEGAKSKGSSRVVVAHNHPSGNPRPSEDDIVATKNLKRDLREEGIDLVDHLVLTDNGVGSMKRDSDLL